MSEARNIKILIDEESHPIYDGHDPTDDIRILQSEITRLRECEIIVRELAEFQPLYEMDDDIIIEYQNALNTAREWVERNKLTE